MATMAEIQGRVARELSSGERLLWSGQPRQGLRFSGMDLLLVPFSLVWSGFVIFWEAMVIRLGAPLFFALWGIPFILVGLYLLVGRFLFDILTRRRTYYVVTDRRALIINDFLPRRIISHDLRQLAGLSLSEGSGGVGTITFGPTNLMVWGRRSNPWASTAASGQNFAGIERAREVYEIIRKAQEA